MLIVQTFLFFLMVCLLGYGQAQEISEIGKENILQHGGH